MVRCVGAVVREDHRALLRKAVRLSFAIDDRDQCFLMRGRLVIPRPEVHFAEFIVGIVRDYGYTAADSSRAAWACLRKMCIIQTGSQPRRGPDAAMPTGSQPRRGPDAGYVDKDLLKHVQEICFAGASDGCGVALKSVQLLRDERLPNLRYQFRDRPHTTRTIMKGVLKYMGGSEELVRNLISGKGSFCKRAKYSRRFRAIWTRKQVAELARKRALGSQPASSGSQPASDDLFCALEHLGYTEYRFDSRSEPMSILCSRLGAVLEVLLEMRDDRLHREDGLWARAVLEDLKGRDGLRKLTTFAMDCDFAVTTTMLVRVQDGSQPDVALTFSEVSECVEVCEALFFEGRCLSLDASNASYTGILLRSLSRLSAKARDALRWPSDVKLKSTELAAAKAYGKTLYEMAKSFLLLNYPDYSWRTKFGCFNCGKGKYPEKLRLKYFGELAVKEYSIQPINGPEAEKLRLAARTEFANALIHMPRLFKETGDNRAAWARYLDGVRQNRGAGKLEFRSTALVMARVTLTYLGILDGTSDIERAFARLEYMGHRERHMDAETVEDSMHVTLEASHGSRSPHQLPNSTHFPLR